MEEFIITFRQDWSLFEICLNNFVNQELNEKLHVNCHAFNINGELVVQQCTNKRYPLQFACFKKSESPAENTNFKKLIFTRLIMCFTKTFPKIFIYWIYKYWFNTNSAKYRLLMLMSLTKIFNYQFLVVRIPSRSKEYLF